jgi:hypothetical protein
VILSVLLVVLLAGQQALFARLIVGERRAAAAERRELLQRIQDPATANAVQAQEKLDVVVDRHYVEFDDDKDFGFAQSMLEN